MKTAIIHGQSHKGSTYHIARGLADKIGGEITEFFLPKDFGEFCAGCMNCFAESEKKCPHYGKLAPITAAMDSADVIILASPVYVYHATGAMKAFLDHYGYRWMVHSPEASMFQKQGVCICTAAGAGLRSTNKDMADSLFFWGIAKIYKYGKGVAAVDWNGVSEKKKRSVDRATTALAKKIVKRNGTVKPGFKTRAMFFAMRLMQKNGFNPRDADHWKENGWTGKKRPWKWQIPALRRKTLWKGKAKTRCHRLQRYPRWNECSIGGVRFAPNGMISRVRGRYQYATPQ